MGERPLARRHAEEVHRPGQVEELDRMGQQVHRADRRVPRPVEHTHRASQSNACACTRDDHPHDTTASTLRARRSSTAPATTSTSLTRAGGASGGSCTASTGRAACWTDGPIRSPSMPYAILPMALCNFSWWRPCASQAARRADPRPGHSQPPLRPHAAQHHGAVRRAVPLGLLRTPELDSSKPCPRPNLEPTPGPELKPHNHPSTSTSTSTSLSFGPSPSLSLNLSLSLSPRLTSALALTRCRAVCTNTISRAAPTRRLCSMTCVTASCLSPLPVYG